MCEATVNEAEGVFGAFPKSTTGTVPVCRGSLRALLLYDIAEEFDLDEIRRLIGGEPPVRSPGFKLPAPGYVISTPPILETCDRSSCPPARSTSASPSLLRL